VPELLYVRTSGGSRPLEPRPIEPPKGDTRSVASLVDEHRRKLENLLSRYVSGEGVYLSRPFPKFARKYSEYDHLARVKEWSAAGGEDEET
jgi:ATP-dependent helicase/nuclease subunit B